MAKMFHNEDARKVPAKTSGRVAVAMLSKEKVNQKVNVKN